MTHYFFKSHTVSQPKWSDFHSVKRVFKGNLPSITPEYSWGGSIGENTVSFFSDILSKNYAMHTSGIYQQNALKLVSK